MKIEPYSLPFFFAAGFSVKEGQEADNQRYQLNQLLESLFYLRFNKSFELIEAPVISLPNSISFTCRLSSHATFLKQEYQASIAAKFTFTCADTTINNFDLECTNVSSLNLHEINNDNEEIRVIPYEEWGSHLFNDQLETLYRSLAQAISTYPVSRLTFFRNGGLDLFDMLEYEIERDAAEKSAYSSANMNNTH